MTAAKRLLRPAAVALLCLLVTACGGAEGHRARHIARGERYLTDGQLDKARVEFANALQIAPNDPQARFLTGTVMEQLGDFQGAASMYQGTIDVDPQHAGARAALARLYVLFKRPEKALELIKPALVSHPNDPELLTVRALARAQLKDPGAPADAERAVSLAPMNEHALAALAGLYSQSGQPQRAIELLRAAVSRAPDSVTFRQILAQVYLLAHQEGPAEEQLNQIVRMRPKELGPRLQLAAFLVQTKRLDAAEQVLQAAKVALPNSDDARLAYVNFLAEQRSPVRAEAALRTWIADRPKDYELQLRLGDLQLKSATPAQAEATYRAIIAADPDGAKGDAARDRLAAIYIAGGRNADAKPLLAASLKDSARDNDALIMRATVALADGDAVAAIADLRTVLRDQPLSLPILRTLARAHVANDEPQLAEENLRAALAVAPRDPGVQTELGRLLIQEHQPDEAIAILEEAVKSAPADATGATVRAALVEAYLAKPDLPAARRTADEIKSLQPESAVGSYLAGLVAQQQGRFDDARKELEGALRLQPSATDALVALARLQFSRGQRAQALALAHAAAERMPANAVAQDLVGELSVTAGDYPTAIRALSEAVRLAPNWWLPYRDLARAKATAGDGNGSRTVYENGVKATEAPALAVDLAQIYVHDGRPDDAIRLYESIYQHKPQLKLIANNLAMLLVTYHTDQPSLDRARDLTAPFANSDVGAFLDTHGWVMLLRGEVSEALTALQRASAKAPASREILYHLGMAQLKAGETDRARSTLEAALAGGASFDGTEHARVALAQLSHGRT